MTFRSTRGDCTDCASTSEAGNEALALAMPGEGEGFHDLAWLATQQVGCALAAVALYEGERLRLVAERGLDASLVPAVEALLRAVGPRLPGLASDEGSVGTMLPFHAASAVFSRSGKLLGAIAVADGHPRPTPAVAALPALEKLAAIAAHMVGYREIKRRHRIAEQLAHVDSSLLLVFDTDGNVSFANMAAQVLLGEACDPTQPIDGLFPARLQPHPAAAARWLDGSAEPATLAQTFDLQVIDAEGEPRTLEALRCAWLAGADTGLALSLRDVTDCPSRQHEVQSRLDALTGLPNRDGLLAMLEGLRARGVPTTVALLGLDNFRSINDLLGHRIGDTALQVVASRLMHWLPADAYLARCGGDEFALVFPCAQLETIEPQLRPMLRGLARACEIEYQRVHVEACVGLALDHAHEDADETLARAGLALQHAKRAGSRQVRRFAPGMRTEAIDRRRLDLELRRAFRQGEFELHYQPQVDLRSGLPAGAEALLRWQHPERGMLGPAEFIDALSRSAIAPAVGRWILQRACCDAATWPTVGGRGITVAVNLFPVQFEDEALPQEIEVALHAAGLPATRLELELTESIALRGDGAAEPALAEISLARLRALGLRVSFDDFGTGHASLSMLHRLPVDRIKIDRSFVRDLAISRGSEAIVRSIVLIARNFDMQVVAEGVEDEAQRAILIGLDCDRVQGFLYAPALPNAEIRRWLLANGGDHNTSANAQRGTIHG